MEAKELNEQIVQSSRDKIKVYPCNNLRASSIGHPCERYLVLLMTSWEMQIPHDEVTQSIFDLGNALEDYTINVLRNTTYNGKKLEIVTPTIRSWRIETPLITGREDCRIKEEDGKLYPVEIKGLSPYEWEKLNTMEDFLNSKKYYIRAYPAQLMCYMWNFGLDHGWFALTNKVTGQVKLIKVLFNWEFADALLAKGTRVYTHVSAKTLPDPIEEEGICEKCSLRNACGHITRIPTDIELDEGLEEMLDRKFELKPLYSEYQKLDEEIKQKLNKRPKVLAGKYLCIYKCTKTPAKKGPNGEEIPEKERWNLSIKNLEEIKK